MIKNHEKRIERTGLSAIAKMMLDDIPAYQISRHQLVPYRDYIGVGRNGSVAKWIPTTKHKNYIEEGHFIAPGCSFNVWQCDGMAYGRTGFSPLAVVPDFEESDLILSIGGMEHAP